MNYLARRSLLSLFLLLAILCGGCGSWVQVRKEVVEPVNELLHHQYRDAIRDEDVAAAVAMYAPESRAEGRKRVLEILKGFQDVENADCIIEAAETHSLRHFVADFHLRLEGRTSSGARQVYWQEGEFECRRGEGSWRIVGHRVLASRRLDPVGPRFTEESELRGIDYTQMSGGVVDRFGTHRAYLAGTGLSVRDVDGNGFDDILMIGGADLRLYMNHGGFFTDETETWGLTPPVEGECRIGAFGDIDGDGDPDLYLGVLDGPSLLFTNEGNRFRVRVADEVGIVSSGETTGACFFDYDNDGRLDLYVINGGNLLRNQPDPIYAAKNTAPNRLFRNLGDGQWKDVTEAAGVGDTGWALACQTSDYDRDGDVDLFVANDFGFDMLYENRGDGTFENVAGDVGIVHRGSSMGAAFGDVNEDGYPDLFVTGMASNTRWMIHQPEFPAPAPFPFNVLFRDRVIAIMSEMFHGNRFYLSDGQGHFREISTPTRTRNALWAWGGIFLDYDNDGRQDIYVVNGFRSGQIPDDL